MGNDRSRALLFAAIGGLLAGVGLIEGSPGWMIAALALLWEICWWPGAAALWGGCAVLESHHWLLALHPLTWMGVPALLSLPVAVVIWLVCGFSAAGLIGIWAWLNNTLARIARESASSSFLTEVSHALLMACLWGLAEVVLAFSPLFWIGIGESLIPGDLWLAGLARMIGSGGLAALLLLLGWWLRRTAVVFRRGGAWLRPLFFGLLLLLLLHGLGWALLRPERSAATEMSAATASSAETSHSAKQPAFAAATSIQPTSSQPISIPAIPVGLWQPAIPTRSKFSEEQQRILPFALEAALADASAENVAWLMAPEGTLPAGQPLLTPAPLPLLTGGFRWVRGQQRSGVLVIEQGERQASKAIDKHRLVPIGEWLPTWLGGLTPGLSAVGGLAPGSPSRLLRWSGPPVAVAICYELSNGSALAAAVAEGGQWLLAIANLDPYPIALQRQFLALAQLRSIETARDLVSVANTGPTALVSAAGQSEQILEPMRAGLGIASVHLHDELSFYTRWRELPLLAVSLISGCCLVWPRISWQQQRDESS